MNTGFVPSVFVPLVINTVTGCTCGVATATCPMSTPNEKALYSLAAETEARLATCCSACGEQPPRYGLDGTGRWRFNGLGYEHKCGDPNAGHFRTEPMKDFIARLRALPAPRDAASVEVDRG